MSKYTPIAKRNDEILLVKWDDTEESTFHVYKDQDDLKANSCKNDTGIIYAVKVIQVQEIATETKQIIKPYIENKQG